MEPKFKIISLDSGEKKLVLSYEKKWIDTIVDELIARSGQDCRTLVREAISYSLKTEKKYFAAILSALEKNNFSKAYHIALNSVKWIDENRI